MKTLIDALRVAIALWLWQLALNCSPRLVHEISTLLMNELDKDSPIEKAMRTMSADNFIACIEVDGGWYVPKYSQSMSALEDNCCGAYKLLMHYGKLFSNRGDALVYAHDCVQDEEIVEYGVIELKALGKPKRCGECYACEALDNSSVTE